MYRIVILYEEAPDAEGYADHVERFCQAPNGAFRHGEVKGARWASRRTSTGPSSSSPTSRRSTTSCAASSSVAAGRDVMERGWKMPAIQFVEIA